MFTITSFSHPKFVKKIRRAIWLCQLEHMRTGKLSVGIVKNRFKKDIMRVAILATGEMVCYVAGRGMQNYSSVVLRALEN